MFVAGRCLAGEGVRQFAWFACSSALRDDDNAYLVAPSGVTDMLGAMQPLLGSEDRVSVDLAGLQGRSGGSFQAFALRAEDVGRAWLVRNCAQEAETGRAALPPRTVGVRITFDTKSVKQSLTDTKRDV